MQFIVIQKTVSMMTYFGKNGVLQVNRSELWHVVSVANKVFFIATKWAQVQRNPSGNYGTMSNLIWSSIEIVFWVWYLIIGSYQLLSITSFCHHQIYYDNIVTNLMASLMLINSYKSTIFNHNSCHGLTLLFPHPLLGIWPKSIDFCLIWPNNPLPILHSSFLVL
jgi:hypothetical protein